MICKGNGVVKDHCFEMNIIVKPYGSAHCSCRPDTTWERENRDFYSPESVSSISWTPVLFVRISKAGKCVSPKFASRYWDAFNYGMLMYAENFIGGSPEAWACASCIDHTSILPFPLFNPVVLDQTGNHFMIRANGVELFDYNKGTKTMVEEAIVNASQLISLRIGDVLAIELQARKVLKETPEKGTLIEGEFCQNPTFDFSIIR